MVEKLTTEMPEIKDNSRVLPLEVPAPKTKEPPKLNTEALLLTLVIVLVAALIVMALAMADQDRVVIVREPR